MLCIIMDVLLDNNEVMFNVIVMLSAIMDVVLDNNELSSISIPETKRNKIRQCNVQLESGIVIL